MTLKLRALFKNPKIYLIFALLFAFTIIGIDQVKIRQSKVLGSQDQTQPTPLPTIAPMTPKPATPSAKPLKKLSKNEYTIALYGDSMIDTMGENLDYLKKALQVEYGQTKFNLYNYGIGSQNIEEGVSRWGQNFNYQTRKFPPIREINPDAIILGSFSYNPFPTHDKAKHARLLNDLIVNAKNVTPNVYLLAEIAPLKNNFGKGPGGVNWDEAIAKDHVLKILDQLQNAQKANAILINAYQKSLYEGNYGLPIYVDGHDGIHPSVEGHVFMANLIARSLNLK